MTLSRSQNVSVERDKNLVAIVIHGAGTLHLPPGTAHGIAREIMRVVGEIEKDEPISTRIARGLKL